MTLLHGMAVKRRTSTPDLYYYGVYLGTVYDLTDQPLCICINPEGVEYVYFLARPDDLFPINGMQQPQFHRVTSFGT